MVALTEDTPLEGRPTGRWGMRHFGSDMGDGGMTQSLGGFLLMNPPKAIHMVDIKALCISCAWKLDGIAGRTLKGVDGVVLV